MKKIALRLLITIQFWQLRRLQKRNKISVVAIAGSIGKTSTKIAVAHTLSKRFKVRCQEGNYNHSLTMPFVFFGHATPALYNPFAWFFILFKNELQILRSYPFEVVVVELGTDGPGQMIDFKRALSPDLGILTSIAPEHMEYFGTLDAVAQEELVLQKISKRTAVNVDLCDKAFINELDVVSYGTLKGADYGMASAASNGIRIITKNNRDYISLPKVDFMEVKIYSYLAAAWVGDELGMSPEEIASAFENMPDVNGRLRKFSGVDGLTIFDDTYNSSPAAARNALKMLEATKYKNKIFLMGSMNELGDYSKEAHETIGSLFYPSEINLVVTLGKDANNFVAPKARQNGCKVEVAQTPYEAASIIRGYIEDDSVLLAKGSQNGVFAEEAVKLLLANPDDGKHLVRQSEHWLKIKKKQFGRQVHDKIAT